MAEQKTLKQPKLFDKIDAKVEGREGLKTVWQAQSRGKRRFEDRLAGG